MYTTDAELIFPPRIIPELMDARGPLWKVLVKTTLKQAASPVMKAAFTLMMARIDNCALCNVDSYRSIQGCLACSKQALKRFRGSDKALMKLYESAKIEVSTFLNSPKIQGD